MDVRTTNTLVIQSPINACVALLSTFANKVVEKIEDERLKLLTEQERINITDIESAHVKPPWLDIPTSDIRVSIPYHHHITCAHVI